MGTMSLWIFHVWVKDMIFFISLHVFTRKITLILFLTVDFYKFLAIIGEYYELKFVCRDVDCKSFKFITGHILENAIVPIGLWLIVGIPTSYSKE